MNYNELKQAVQDYLETSETKFVNNIPLFVQLVEQKVYNEVEILSLRKNVQGYAATGERYLSVPDDFIACYSVAMIDPASGEYSYAKLKDVNLIREIYPSPTYTGKPKFFGIFDEQTLIFGPTPDKDYSVELHYFYFPESLVTAGTTWLSEHFPFVMLYGVVAEGYRFNKGDAAQQKVYDEQYDRAIGLLTKTGDARRRNDAYHNKQTKPATTTGE